MAVKEGIQVTNRAKPIHGALYEQGRETDVDTARRIAWAVGALFIASNITFLLGAFVLVEPILGAADYLTLASAQRTQLVAGALLELVNAVFYIGIAVLMYRILRQRFPVMALWYVCFRVIEFVMQSLSDISALSLLGLSEEVVGSGAAESSYLAAGSLLLAQRAWAFQMVTVALVLGALVFYTMLYRSRLVPRFISVWGLIGAIGVLATALLEMFGVSPGPLEFLGLLMLANELFLGIWLIVRGFRRPPASPSAT